MQLNEVAPERSGSGDGDMVVHDNVLGALGNAAYTLRQHFSTASDHARQNTFDASIQLFNDGLDMGSGNPMPADVGDGATISDHAAMAVQACTYKGEESQYILEIDWVDTPKNTAERREALEKLLRAHLPVIMEAEGCRP
ncbi:hypothetical protein AAIB46_05240 [Streptomyces sp. 35M1]|uniref:hypothetical protein n=1 Tax=Streptomyces sp. 35M1 TaxID=3142978 RepID=UPI003990E016